MEHVPPRKFDVADAAAACLVNGWLFGCYAWLLLLRMQLDEPGGVVASFLSALAALTCMLACAVGHAVVLRDWTVLSIIWRAFCCVLVVGALCPEDIARLH